MKVEEAIAILATENPKEEILVIWWTRDDVNEHFDVELSEPQWDSVIASHEVDAGIESFNEYLSDALEDFRLEDDGEEV
ncbi:hypothetical protein CH252_04920 [Rhodococcus sp. 06-1477-1B]|nr:hypothetical protein CH252_04920 [Rhodococcus sp. 06-1477-1B]